MTINNPKLESMRLSELPEVDKTLRPYQVTGKQEIYRAWDTCRTVLFQMPTGTGKTRLFSSIIKDLRRLWEDDKKIRRALVLAHRHELIKQIEETLSQKYHISCGIIMSGTEETWNRQVQVASIQTISHRLEKWTAKDFDYIIIDEAHHAVSPTYFKVCKQFPKAKILGVTATPCRLTGDSLRKLFGILIVSQPITKFIEQNYLSDYSYYSIKPSSTIQRDLDNITHFKTDGDYADADMMRIVDNRRVRANIVEAYEKYAKGKKGIIYTINQEHNKHICEAFEKIGVKIKAIDSKTPEGERKKTVDQFRYGGIDIICNVNIFSEGFDCPDIEFIQLARPTCSLAMYLQQVGRGLRPHPQGIPATILDNVGSYNKFGLPSANRQWRRHFEGEGQRVTKSSSNNETGEGIRRDFREGDEDMVLIFSENSPVSEQSRNIDILYAIQKTKEWFPFGATSLLDPYCGFIDIRKIGRNGCLYFEYDDIEQWYEAIEDEIDTDRDMSDNANKQDEIDWVEEKIRRIFRFTYQGKYGICQFVNSPTSFEKDINLCENGKKSVEDVITILLPPVYDNIGIPDDQGRSICIKDGKYGVLSSESYLPIVSFKYEALEFQQNGLYLALYNNKVGLIKGDDPVIPFEYDEIEYFPISLEKLYYFLREENHYRLVYFKKDYQANQQDKLPIKQLLIDSLYVGESAQHHGFICNSEGEILYPMFFERIGFSHISGKTTFILGIEDKAFKLNKNLSTLSIAGKCELSDDAFINQFHLDNLIVIKETGKKKSKGPLKEQWQQKQIGDLKFIEKTEIDTSIDKDEKQEESKSRSKPVLPTGVFKGNDGKYGYSSNGRILLNPEYDLITPYETDRLIVKKGDKFGVFSIENETITQILKFIFKGLKGTQKHRYNVTLYKGYSEEHTEEFLRSILLQTEQHLIYKSSNGTIQIFFQTTCIAEYKEVIHLGKEVFIAKNILEMYGLIRCKQYSVEEIRHFEYSKIELSDDKRNVLLYKSGRPRFISLIGLLSNK